jgi:Rrf2 family transcriptional regulator, nitric oxide-sensitive transcriptional repressor
MLSQTVEYALRAVAALAQAGAEQRTVAQLAKQTKTPPAYLGKVLQGLRRAGIVASRRGAGGGVALARDPAGLSMLEVVNAVEPIQRIRSCPLKLAAHGVRLCPLHRRLDNALASVETAFAGVTVAEVLAEPSDSVPLCPFPAKPVAKA